MKGVESMLVTMSGKEVADWNERVRSLRTSNRTVDNLTAILMDTEIGHEGLHEEVAKAKAEEILKYWLTR